MLTATLTQHAFQKRKNMFNAALQANPVECMLKLTLVTAGTNQFDSFTGDQERRLSLHTLKCLYKRDFTPAQRMKYGYEENVSAVAFFSPEELLEKVGTYNLDFTKVSATIAGIDYAATKVIQLGALFSSCLAIEIRLTTPLKF